MIKTTRAVAIDGPSGSGKSTVARRVAQALRWRYVDTGATYRAVTLAALRRGVCLQDTDALTRLVRGVRLGQDTDPAAPVTRLDGEDVSVQIRGPAVTAAVSAVSAVPEVRARMVQLQRDLAGQDGAVVEGRDVGAVVLPDAAVKIYLDAAPRVRAERRAADCDTGIAPTAGGDLREAVAADLARRDSSDMSRPVSPLAVPAGAVQLDSSAMTVDEVVDVVLALVRQTGLADLR